MSLHRFSSWYLVDMALTDYRQALDIMASMVGKLKEGLISKNLIILTEHKPVFTLGRRGEMANSLISKEDIEKAEIPIIQTDRGGDITYHGPGQLIAYPLVNIKREGISVVDFVSRLEEVMIRSAGDWGVTACRSDINRGVFVGISKLGSVGIAIKKGITYHGIALNVNNPLSPFEWINPCGLRGVKMTSLKNETGSELPFDKVKISLLKYIESIFNVSTEKTELQNLI